LVKGGDVNLPRQTWGWKVAMNVLAPTAFAAYQRDGFFLARGVVPIPLIDGLLTNFVGLLNKISGLTLRDAHSGEVANKLGTDLSLQSGVYNAIRKPDWLLNFSSTSALCDIIRELLGQHIVLMSKIPFRIDVPQETKELAVWHQDYFYVRGNTDIVTAWIPMQDTNYTNGCLSVMPGSHLLGPLEHDGRIGKRHFPTKHLNREIRLVEMKKGDALLFHSALLHTGNLNFSNAVRYSVQPRYSRADSPTDTEMGDRITL
jgi:hypothetical protein